MIENSNILSLYYSDVSGFGITTYGVLPTLAEIEAETWKQLDINSDTSNSKVNAEPLEQMQFGDKIRPGRTQKGFDRPVFEFERVLTPGFITQHLDLMKSAFGEYTAKQSDIQLTEFTSRTSIKVGANTNLAIGTIIAIKSDTKLQFNIIKEITGSSSPYTLTLAYPITVDTIATNHVIYVPPKFRIDILHQSKKYHVILRTKDRTYLATHCSIVMKLNLESNSIAKFIVSIIPYEVKNITADDPSLTITTDSSAGVGSKANFSFVTIGDLTTGGQVPDFNSHEINIAYERTQNINESSATEQGIIGVDDNVYSLTLTLKTFDTAKYESLLEGNDSFWFKGVRVDGAVIIDWGGCYVKKIEPLSVTDNKISGEIEINPVVDMSIDPYVIFGLE